MADAVDDSTINIVEVIIIIIIIDFTRIAASYTATDDVTHRIFNTNL